MLLDIFYIAILIITFQFPVVYLLFWSFFWWMIFKKSNQKPWLVFIPVYNLIILLDIVKWNRWWVMYLLIPFFNIVPLSIIFYNLGKVYKRSETFCWGLALFQPILLMFLAFDNSRYHDFKYIDRF